MKTVKHYSLHFLAIAIAVLLWFQVHGQGQGSLSIDVPLQVEGLPAKMMIVNDLPDHVRVTVKGLQSRLKDLRQQGLVMPLDLSDMNTPSVVSRALNPELIALPAGVRVEKVQPDRMELQVDRLVRRSLPLHAHFELPEGWRVEAVVMEPKSVELMGPEVWLESLTQVETHPIRLELKQGDFKVSSRVESPTSKAIRLVESQFEVSVSGRLLQDQLEVIAVPEPAQSQEEQQ